MFRRRTVLAIAVILAAAPARGGPPGEDPLYRRIKGALDKVPAISTHEHLRPFRQLPGLSETPRGRGMTLAGVWQVSYFPTVHALSPRRPEETAETWWRRVRPDFENARATSVYRYMLPAFRDLYDVDFDRLTEEQVGALDARVFENYRDDRWLVDVITRRANIELMLNDPYWAPFDFRSYYPFTVLVLRVDPLIRGFHPSEFASAPDEDPYQYARRRGLAVNSLGDYLALVEAAFREAKEAGAATLKSALAYRRDLRFENVPRARAEAAFGRPRSALTPAQVRDFEDFLMWHLVGLSARYGLPFQIHTGWGQIQGSNPMLLVDMIAANPRTRFILFHGGFPWVAESGVIAMRHRNVWLDSCWLPTLSFSAAKRAYREWLEILPPNRIMWGADSNTAEGIYGATEFTRRALAEVLAEKVKGRDLDEEQALRVGRQVLRDNALELFPQLKARLGKRPPPEAAPRP